MIFKNALRFFTEKIPKISGIGEYIVDFPEAFALCQDEPWILREVRSMSVDNYRLFYHIDHDKRIVVILRVFYCRQETKLPSTLHIFQTPENTRECFM